MKKYISYVKLRFCMGLQYRADAFSGVLAQFLWGCIEILIFKAFYEFNSNAFPMNFNATVSYIWLQQIFLAFFGLWFLENDIFESIQNGNISYELCRPIQIYNIWFARSMALRLSKAFLRCFPILFIIVFLPHNYCLSMPANLLSFLLFLISISLSLIVSISVCMVLYIISFFTISSLGIKSLFVPLIDFLSGRIIPLPFLPDSLRKYVELLPFASMQNAPFCIYTGYFTSRDSLRAIILQCIWIIVLISVGYYFCEKAEKKIVLQGG